MKIDSVIEKGIGPINEDFLLIKENLFGVFDGASSLIKKQGSKKETGGFLAAKMAQNIFSENEDKHLIDVARDINKKLREAMDEEKIDFNKTIESWLTTVAVVRIKKDFLEYFQIGDSPLIIIYKDKKIDVFVNEDWDKKSLILWKKITQEGIIDVRNDERMIEQLNKVRRRANIDYGFLNGQDICFKFAKEGSIPLVNINHIILLTDGLLIPKKDPTEDIDFNQIVELVLSSGLSGLKKYVRDIEESDPHCKGYPRFKKHDDLAGILISF